MTPIEAKTIRLTLGLKQTEFAELIGTYQPQVRNWEGGIHSPYSISIKKIDKIYRKIKNRSLVIAEQLLNNEEHILIIFDKDDITEKIAKRMAFIHLFNMNRKCNVIEFDEKNYKEWLGNNKKDTIVNKKKWAEKYIRTKGYIKKEDKDEFNYPWLSFFDD